MKYDPNHKPTDAAAKAADLPEGFTITGAIRKGASVYTAGSEEKYAATKPSVADVQRLEASGVLVIPASKAKK